MALRGTKTIAGGVSVPATYVRSLVLSRRHRGALTRPQVYCSFIGYARSGHTLVGQLLNAHPQIVIANELNVLRLLRWKSFTARQLYALIVDRDREYSAQGSASVRYKYAVDGQWQGRFRDLRVIGDKKGGGSSWELRKSPDVLDRLRRTVDVPLRFVHVVRNPYDNITTQSKRKGVTLEAAATEYLALVETNAAVRRRLRPEEFIDVRLETLVGDPKGELRRLCAFLGVDADDDYLAACAGVIFPSPRKSRDSAQWPPELARRVQERIERVDFLDGYTWDS